LSLEDSCLSLPSKVSRLCLSLRSQRSRLRLWIVLVDVEVLLEGYDRKCTSR
jgi:hypothetical protein